MDPQMTHPNHNALDANRHVERALEHAHRLSESRSENHHTPEWWAEAKQVGDLTALASLTLTRSH
jgi:hypothetical protein